MIAPDQELTIRQGVMVASQPTAPRGHRYPIDLFLRSVAEDQGELAIAIVLSGTGTDGSVGLRFIKSAGGIVIAQDPGAAGFAGMPRSAIATGIVDLVLAPEKMPAALLRLSRHPYLRQLLPAVGQPDADHGLSALLTVLRSRTGQDFSAYRKQTLLRRLQRRMGLHGIEDPADYVERLRTDHDETAALARDLTISATSFFRDPEAWQVLEHEVITPLVRERPLDSPIRVWVPGCSTGEEAYSTSAPRRSASCSRAS